MDPSPVQGLTASGEHKPISFGRYKLVRRIGAGGMGEVFLARDESTSQPRACVIKKVLRHLVQNANFVNRFLDESKVVVRLNHPNIARVYAMGEVAGEYFLAMEYVQGKTVSRFARRLRDRKQVMPLGMILLLGERICQGLAYAHEAVDEHGAPLELVHRDLSPANVCVGYRGEVKIIDFGAAQSTLKESQTAPRVVIGNLTYMAPEQAQKHFVDRRADVYSLGVTLWELFAWSPLPQKGDPLERWRRAANPSWDPPSSLRPELPKELDDVLGKALRKDPEERYADAREFGKALGALRARLAPELGEEQLAQTLSTAFQKEKAAEDEALRELLGGVPLSEAPTDVTRRVFFVPPTAMAFEHRALKPPDFAALEEATDPGAPPVTAQYRKRITGEDLKESRVGFGMAIAPPQRPEEEQALLRELVGDEPDIESVELESREEEPAAAAPGAPTSAVSAPLPALASTAPLPPDDNAATMRVEALYPDAATAPTQRRARPARRKVRWGMVLVGTGVFLGALSVGFAAVWMLAS